MSVTPFLGSGTPSLLSQNSGNGMALPIIPNPLTSQTDMPGIIREASFELLSLLNHSEEESTESVDPELSTALPLAPDVESAEIPVIVTGDKTQNLLTHLLSASEDVPVAAAIHRMKPMLATESLALKSSALPLNQSRGNANSVDNSAQLSVATGLTRNVDALTPVKPQFFAQALLNGGSTPNEQTSLELNSSLSAAVKSLADSGEGFKPALSQNTGQSVNSPNVNNDTQFNWSPIKLRGSQEQMSEQLHSVLRERLQIQTDSRVQQATIRLDPPDLGKIDISLHIDAGKLNIQIHASQSDVYRSLQQMSNELRQHLTEQNFVQVNVQVFSDSSHQGQEKRRETFKDDSILTAQEIKTSSSQVGRRDDSILTTV